MAEASSDSSASVASSIDSILTDCPICLEQFRSPKSLPCLHTFCKECLREFIQNHATNSPVTGFPCPICRQIAKPVNPEDDSSKWAEQFPTNNFVTAILEMRDLQISEKLCTICQKKNNLTSQAEYWCKDCATFLCVGCREVHEMFTDSHDLLTAKDIKDDPLRALTFIRKCDTHDEELKLFCYDHQALCCTMCVAVEHRRCETVITMKEQAKSLKDGKTTGDVIAKIDKQIHSLDKMMENSEAHVEKLSNDKTKILTEVKELRSMLDKHLDKLEEKFAAELEENIKSQVSSTEKRIKQIQSLRCAIVQSQKQIQAAHSSMNDTQTVQILMSAKTQQEFYEQQLCDIVVKYENLQDSVKPSDGVLALLSADSIVELKTEVLQLPDHIAEIRKINPFCGCKSVLTIGTFPVHASSCRITGAIFVDKNRLVTVDQTNLMLNCHSADGKLMFDLKLDTDPWDVCKVHGNILAITALTTLFIVEVLANKFSIRQKITVPERCYGIACIDPDTFFLTCSHSSKVLIVNKSGQVMRSTLTGNSSMFHAVNTRNGRVVMSTAHTTKDKQILQILNKEEALENFFYSDIASGGRGLDSDEFENIYLCAKSSNHVVMVSPTGQGKVLLSEKDGLHKPCAVAVNGDRMVVFEEISNIGKIFQFQY